MVRGNGNHQYHRNGEGDLVRYDARILSVKRETAERYIRAMGLDPRAWLDGTD